MKNKKIRFNILDLLILIIVAFIIFGTIIRNTNVSEFNLNNTVTDSIITISVDSIDGEVYGQFRLGDVIYAELDGEKIKLGRVKNMNFVPSVVPHLEGESVVYVPDSRHIDVTFDIETRIISDENGFNILDGKYISPGLSFSANNGRVKLLCSVESVVLLQ